MQNPYEDVFEQPLPPLRAMDLPIGFVACVLSVGGAAGIGSLWGWVLACVPLIWTARMLIYDYLCKRQGGRNQQRKESDDREREIEV